MALVGNPVITVVICTRDRAAILPRCLDGLVRQTLPFDRFEVVLVANAASDDTIAVAESHIAALPNLRVIAEPVLGLSRARNTGLATATTPLVAFVDDDAVARPDWLDRFLAAFDQAERPHVVGGELEPVWEVEPPDWLQGPLMRYYAVCLGWSTTSRFLTAGEWLCESNCAYDAEALRKAGGFPEYLGRRGPVMLSGEHFVNEIIAANGGRQFFAVDAIVDHYIPAARMTTEWLARRVFWGGIEASIRDRKRAELFDGEVAAQRLSMPETAADWDALFDPHPGPDLRNKLRHAFSVGYELGQSGVLGPLLTMA